MQHRKSLTTLAIASRTTGFLLQTTNPRSASAIAINPTSSYSLIRVSQQYQLYTQRLFYSSPSLLDVDKRLFEEELNIIYDSKCNVCKLEIDFLARRDSKLASSRKLKMTDLECPAYNPKDPSNGGVSYEQGMAAIHAVTADGKVINGVPVFSAAYQLVEMGWLLKFTEWPILKDVVIWGYNLFAKYRTNITRGSSLEDLVEAYNFKLSVQEAQLNEDCSACNNFKR
jgi:predicted DCC family thiol-disulfide oxidoreductase YuxK